jgi:hypothetical protein
MIDRGRSQCRIALFLLALLLVTTQSFGQSPAAGVETRFTADLRRAVLTYSAGLPNFICRQTTRRSFDAKSNGGWRDLDEISETLSFFEGKEHYQTLKRRQLATHLDTFPPRMNSNGEFLSLLRQIFEVGSGARFSRDGLGTLRGRKVELVSYEVDMAHSKYEVHWREKGIPQAVVDAYRGQIFVDPETLAVLRLTLEVQPLPEPFPVRDVSITLDYSAETVAGGTFYLPHAFTMVLRLQKGASVRNSVVFTDYRRYAADSRIVPDEIR